MVHVSSQETLADTNTHTHTDTDASPAAPLHSSLILSHPLRANSLHKKKNKADSQLPLSRRDPVKFAQRQRISQSNASMTLILPFETFYVLGIAQSRCPASLTALM